MLCGQCGQVQTVDEVVAGMVECSHCGHSMAIPGEFDPSATVTNVEPPTEEQEGFAEIARKAVPRKVRLTCTECGKRFSVSARRAGRQGRCPACGSKIDVPYPDDNVKFDLPRVQHTDLEQDEEPVELVAIDEPLLLQAQRSDDALVLPRDPVTRRRLSLDEQVAALAAAAAEAAAPPPPRAMKPIAPKPPIPVAPPPPAVVVRSLQPIAPIDIIDAEEDEEEVIASSKRLYVLIAAGVALAVLAGLGLHFLGGSTEPPGTSMAKKTGRNGRRPDNGKPPNNGKLPGNGSPPGNGKPPRNGGKPPRNGGTPPRNGGKPPRNGGTPRNDRAPCQVTAARLDVFANGGYFPAPPSMAYLKATVTVKAVDKAVDFHTGQDVTLAHAQGQVPSLGSLAPPRVVPVLSQSAQLHLEKGQSRELTLLFLVPSNLSGAELTIRNVGSATLPAVSRPATPPAKALVGSFDEAQPRNLRPVMEDPVIAAVQGARGQKLYVHRRNETLQMYISPAAVRGVVTPVGPGEYETTLKHGKEERMCRLRLTEGGQKLIVYFSHKPFHQMTYIRAKR